MSETVEDILAEMRDMGMTGCRFGSSSIMDFADRIDAAYKRDLQSMCDAGEIDMRTAMGEVERLKSENISLYDRLNQKTNELESVKEMRKRNIHSACMKFKENARLKSDIAELLKCLQKVYDEECTDYGTGEVFNRISAKMNGGAK